MTAKNKNSRVKKINVEDYRAVCVLCGNHKDISLWPHRNENGSIVGFVFGCENCKADIQSLRIAVTTDPVPCQTCGQEMRVQLACCCGQTKRIE